MLLPLVILSSLVFNLLAIHVAFIIAGSPRIFIYPAVHESIRVNLISAFCPVDTCSADVFVRVSLSDNTHTVDGVAVANSKGVVIPADEEERPFVRHALHRLHLAVRGAMNATWVDVGSVAERDEMKAHFNSSRHRVFRELDPRRYSMYFGRWSAFNQARSYEREHGLRYAWFVHTRFDMAFGAPIQPYFKWPSTKLWVHDTWAADVPDIFALIPAAFADAYFSMDLLVQEQAMCLGGPNFNKSSVEDSALIAMGFSAHERYIAETVLCWGDRDGWSEEILRKKLNLANVSLQSGKIGLKPIFSFILRKDLNDLCQLVHPSFMIGWLWDTQIANGAMFAGCVNFAQDIRREMASPRCPSLPLMSDEEFGGDECLLGRNISGWNYMPYRIRLPPRRGGHCLTASGDNVTHIYTLSFAPCISLENLESQPKIRYTYSRSQLFRFYSDNLGPQQVRHLASSSSDSVRWLCMKKAFRGNAALKSYSVLEKCDQSEEKQLFRISVFKRRRQRIQGESKQITFTEFGTISRNDRCLSYSTASVESSSPIIPYWEDCKRKKSGDPTVRQVFAFEKTSVANVFANIYS